ncbi:MAG: lipopolysaccharide biosynthesis protein, partial [Ruminococcus sp.]|nr:lipopolysaccharide biosynthesis protein [Ruminococcus sp.]
FLFQVSDTLYQDLRSLVIGRKYDSATLGYYNKGKHFPQFINNAVNGTLQSVMLPAMSTKQDDKAGLKMFMRNSIKASAYLITPIMAGLAATAEPLVVLLLTEKWLPCVPYLQIYCFTFAFYPVNTCNLQAINAMGRSDIFLKLEVIKKIYGIIALIIAVVFFDSPIAIALTGAITSVIGCFVNAFPNKKLIGYSYFEQMKDMVPSLISSLVMFACVLLIQLLNLPSMVTLIIQVITGIVVYAVISLVFKPVGYTMLKDMITNLLKKKKSVSK